MTGGRKMIEKKTEKGMTGPDVENMSKHAYPCTFLDIQN